MNKMLKTMLIAAPVLLVAACGGGDDSLDDRSDVADPKVRLVHAVPLGPNVSLFRGGEAQTVANVPYKGASTYFDTASGSAEWDVRTTAAPNASIGKVTFDSSRGNKYTLVAVPDAGTATEVLLIADPYNKGLTADNARVRVLNASFNATNIDAYLTRAGVDIASATPQFSGVGYKAAKPASGEDSIDVNGDDPNYVLTLTVGGSKTPVFRAPVVIAKNEDWLLTLLPNGVTPNSVKVLLVKANDPTPSEEIVNAL